MINFEKSYFTVKIQKTVKLIRRVKIAHSFLQSVSNQLHAIIFKLANLILQMAVKEFFQTQF